MAIAARKLNTEGTWLDCSSMKPEPMTQLEYAEKRNVLTLTIAAVGRWLTEGP